MPVITLNQKLIPYHFRRSPKAKRLRLEYKGLSLHLIAPFRVPNKLILQFLFQHKAWLIKQTSKRLDVPEREPITSERIASFKAQVYESVQKYSDLIGKKPKSVYLKTQKRRWGSCGIHDQIYINWVLMQAPPEVLDYVVLHECCHLWHRNHGPYFWGLVQRHMPDYKLREKWLRLHAHLLDAPTSPFLSCQPVL